MCVQFGLGGNEPLNVFCSGLPREQGPATALVQPVAAGGAPAQSLTWPRGQARACVVLRNSPTEQGEREPGAGDTLCYAVESSPEGNVYWPKHRLNCT